MKFPTLWHSIIITVVTMVLAIIAVISQLVFGHYLNIDKELLRLLTYVTPMIPIALLCYIIGQRVNSVSSFETQKFNYWVIPLVCIGALAIMLVSAQLSSIIPMPDGMKSQILALLGEYGIWSLLLFVVFAPVIEEYIFRGVILRGLLVKMKPIWAIVISSFLFGIVHLNPWQFIGAFLIGIFTGWLYYRTKNLLLSIAVHFTCNLFGYLTRVRYSQNPDIISWDNAYAIFGLENPLPYTLLSLFILVFIIVVLNRNLKKENNKITNL